MNPYENFCCHIMLNKSTLIINTRAMKRILMTIMLTMFMSSINAVAAISTGKHDAVSMVSYEQRWLDRDGTIALKNNTSEHIHSVSFVLEYLDMQGTPLDYETFSYNVDIAPGKTKKLDVPAYEHDRHYYYYRSEGISGSPKFKLRYELKNYNCRVEGTAEENSVRYDDNNDISAGVAVMSIAMIVVLLIVLGVYVGMYVLVAVMAQRRNRNPVLWLLLSFIATPFLICIVLFAIGSENGD